MTGKQLRTSILQEAITGRLVLQDSADEPASKLLKKIRAKKEKLIKEGKLPKDKNETVIFRGDDKKFYEQKGRTVTCINEQLPFEIPDSWEWCRLESVVQINPKNKSPDDALSAFIPMEKMEATYGSQYTYDEVKWGSIKSGYTHFADGDVAFAKITPCFQNRKSAVFKNLPNGIGAGTTELKVLRPCGETIDRWYLLYFLKSAYFVEEATFKGTANQQRIVKGYLENKLFPIPPLAEQKRIVAKIEELMPLVDEYEKAQEEFDNLNAGLKGKLRASILQEAIAGRLVPQDPRDEPASELLKRINPKAKPLETEQPLPEGWCACKMGELIDIVSGVSYEKGDVTSDGIRILRGGNIQDGKILTYPDDVFLGTKYRNSTNSVRKGDIVMVASTGSFIALGKTGYCLEGMENTQIGAFLRIIRAKGKSLSPLLNLFFSSDAFKTLIRRSSKGTSINNIKNGYITEIVFSLPPLAEQKRIVEKLEELFTKLDALSV